MVYLRRVRLATDWCLESVLEKSLPLAPGNCNWENNRGLLVTFSKCRWKLPGRRRILHRKGGRSMFDLGLIVLEKVVVYVRREIGLVHGLAEENGSEWEVVMRVSSRLRSGLIRH